MIRIMILSWRREGLVPGGKRPKCGRSRELPNFRLATFDVDVRLAIPAGLHQPASRGSSVSTKSISRHVARSRCGAPRPIRLDQDDQRARTQ
jgi:hypothetical protein